MEKWKYIENTENKYSISNKVSMSAIKKTKRRRSRDFKDLPRRVNSSYRPCNAKLVNESNLMFSLILGSDDRFPLDFLTGVSTNDISLE